MWVYVSTIEMKSMVAAAISQARTVAGGADGGSTNSVWRRR
jgi:hypothetical protein